jgi:vacuolar-type H+-ATPase subunit F/Vma7
MSHRIHVIAPPGLAAGFRLAGLAVEEAATPRDAEALVRAEAARPDAGVILVQQALYEALPLAMRREIERRPVPIVVPVPAAQWAEERRRPEDYILDLLQRAIGYRVRLQ